MTKWNENIFRANDIRGIYKKDFDLNFVEALADGFLEFEKVYSGEVIKRVVIGYDARLSGPEIAHHLSYTFKKKGVKVCFLGMVPSPLCTLASYVKNNVSASIMVTASHNPPNFNGFKIVLNKETICGNKMMELKKLIRKKALAGTKVIGKKGMQTHLMRTKPLVEMKFPLQGSQTPPLQGTKPLVEMKFPLQGSQTLHYDIIPAYVRVLKKSFGLKKKGFLCSPIKKIAIDCGNGVSGPVAQKVFKALKLPIKVHWLFVEPDGRFPNHPPDPSKQKNLKELKKTIELKKCDFGVAFDGDGDRLVVVDKNKRVFHGDELMAIFISHLKWLGYVFSVVADVKCADWFFNFLKKHKIPYFIGKSGHSLIRTQTVKKKALFGGELSGHFYFQDHFFPIDDGLFGLLRLIEVCHQANKTPEQLLEKERGFQTQEIRFSFKDRLQAKALLKKLKTQFQKEKAFECLFVDGVRTSLPGRAWGVARLSNTQNEWTFRFGGKTLKDLKAIQKKFYTLLRAN